MILSPCIEGDRASAGPRAPDASLNRVPGIAHPMFGPNDPIAPGLRT